ncbi:MAG: metalloprotease TldD [Francisellaceae bacterium]|jgi:TldD protein|nr:metalloprotease TldD [Francisellaceae bacterium]MBT6206974.1 metalloprotease TldD [Francisellaceae bacterium]
MDQAVEIAKQTILEPASLTDNQLSSILGGILKYDVDYADIYFQVTRSESWVLENRIIKDGSFSINKGVGIRAVHGEKTGFAYTDDVLTTSIIEAANAASAIAKQGGDHSVELNSKPSINSNQLYSTIDPITSCNENEKISLLKSIDEYIRAKDTRVQEVIASLGASHDVVFILASDGTYKADVRPLVRVNISIIVEENNRRENGSSGGGGRFGLEIFKDLKKAYEYADRALHQALTNLEAIPAPAGLIPVVLGPGWPAVLLHEAVGHGLEGDFNRKGSSSFSGCMGEKVASSLCTIVDDGTLVDRRGSLNIDDEGIDTQCTTLIENGILKGYMQDKLNAKLMKCKSTGNGRRESYSCLPMPRMTNTYMLPGKSEHDEIIRSVKKGLYAVNFGGGQVDITSGKFVFSANEAYLIEDGKITAPVKGATLIGNGPEAMMKISMVGNNLELDSGVGVCGKDGQSVPVGVGQPTLLIDEMTVGGTQS